MPKHSAISAPVIRRPPQRRDRLHALLGRAMTASCFGADERSSSPLLALGAIARDPLARRAVADSGGLGRLRQRPTILEDPIDQQPAPLQAERER